MKASPEEYTEAQIGAQISGLEQRREDSLRLIAMAEQQANAPRHVITPRKIEAFSKALRDKLCSGDPGFCKAYLRLFIDRIQVDDAEVRISSSKAVLEKAMSGEISLEGNAVPTFVQDWRATFATLRLSDTHLRF